MTFEEMQKEAHRNAVEKGFWEGKDPVENLPVAISLQHSELSEALEEIRKPNLDPRHIYLMAGLEMKMKAKPYDDSMMQYVQTYGWKPEGVTVEWADTIIRIMDNCEALGISGETLLKTIELKMAYNKTRPHKHGGKKI